MAEENRPLLSDTDHEVHRDASHEDNTTHHGPQRVRKYTVAWNIVTLIFATATLAIAAVFDILFDYRPGGYYFDWSMREQLNTALGLV